MSDDNKEPEEKPKPLDGMTAEQKAEMFEKVLEIGSSLQSFLSAGVHVMFIAILVFIAMRLARSEPIFTVNLIDSRADYEAPSHVSHDHEDSPEEAGL